MKPVGVAPIGYGGIGRIHACHSLRFHYDLPADSIQIAGVATRDDFHTRLKGQVTFNSRFTPAVIHARQLMSAGFTGRVFHFHTRYHRFSYIAPAKPLSWRLSRAAAGGGRHSIIEVFGQLGALRLSRGEPDWLSAQNAGDADKPVGGIGSVSTKCEG